MENLVTIFKVLGDESRLKIVKMLLGKELCVCDILDAFETEKTQPVISHHLKTLKNAGLVSDSRDGKWIYYSLTPKAFEVVGNFISEIKPELYSKERVAPCSSNRIVGGEFK
ncbi:ArsR/SmtB family transcription factor [Sporomusa malonica]|uniref:Transcriptional regulator, ArsR family n=1 Tax=Sporomusa malonica TaxID=112901 RepID=A0A1W2DQG1_9FIRM|nr:metalloregulator ArsR/SmtB family transcription factor [Sporomusa malonica]SMC99674.1 transcriptional regulator, ArsR family [Sporomusa malonica]